MATQLIKYVKPADGDYTSLEACMNANEQDLTDADPDADGNYLDVEIDGSWESADTTAVTIHNYTTDATRYINIYTTATARHDGRAAAVASRNSYRLYQAGIAIASPYTTVTGIEIYGLYSGDISYAAFIDNYGGGQRCMVFDKMIVHDCTGRYTGIVINAAYNDSGVKNSIVYDCNEDYSRGIFGLGGNEAAFCYNNTVYNCGNATGQTTYGYGIGGNLTVKNCIAVSNGGASPLDFLVSTDHNISSDSTATGTGSLISKTATNQFVSITANSENLHLKAGADAIDVGTDLSAVFTTDIDGTTRPTGANTWDIGADEYVAAGTSIIPQRMLMGVGA